jgi:hypothetical protein
MAAVAGREDSARSHRDVPPPPRLPDDGEDRRAPRFPASFEHLRLSARHVRDHAVCCCPPAAETGSRVISLGTLLGEIVADPARLTRDWYLATFDADDQHYAAEVWQNGWFAGPSWQHVNPGPVRDDLSQLAAVSDQVREYVNRHLAHHDRRPLSQLPTFADLNSAIDTIGDLARKYAALLTNTDWITLVPVIQYNWLAVFQEPWIKDEQVLYDLMSEDPLTGRRS